MSGRLMRSVLNQNGILMKAGITPSIMVPCTLSFATSNTSSSPRFSSPSLSSSLLRSSSLLSSSLLGSSSLQRSWLPFGQVCGVSTKTRKVWKRKKDAFLKEVKVKMRRMKLPQIDCREQKFTNDKRLHNKSRPVSIQHRLRLSHKLFRRER